MTFKVKGAMHSTVNEVWRNEVDWPRKAEISRLEALAKQGYIPTPGLN